MKPGVVFWVGGAAALLAALAWSGRETARANAAHEATATAEARLNGLRAEHARLAQRLQAAQHQHTKLQAALDQLRAAAAAAKAGSDKAKVAPPMPGPMDVLQKDPQLQVRFLAMQRTRIARTFGPLLRTLGLAGAEAEKFTDLMVRRQEKNMDLDAIARERGLAADAPEITALRRTAAEEFERDQRALLGDAGLVQLKAYERAAPAREIVERFVGAAVVNDVPLTWQQAEQFTRVISEASPVFATGGTARPATIDWAAVDARATTVLSAEQLALFRAIEPIGGGASRWMAQLDQAISAARTTTNPEQKAAIETVGKKGPGG